jgi:hypothetical protein
VLDLLALRGEETDAIYFEKLENRWRIRSNQDDLLPPTPRVLATDSGFLITLATVAAVAGIVGGASAVVSAVHDVREGRREKKARAKNTVADAGIGSDRGPKANRHRCN